jgi:hypothetical protein
MENKYIGLNERSPKEAAVVVGKVEKSNYLAHTIREIELAILKTRGIHYHIITYASNTQNRTAKIHFSDQCSIIRLPSECGEMDDKIIRLILAHELGHLVYNFDNLKTPEILENSKPSDEEEGFAWVFAYHLINIKSDQHRSDIRRNQFVYDGGDLKRALSNIVKKKKPEIHDIVMRDLALS